MFPETPETWSIHSAVRPSMHAQAGICCCSIDENRLSIPGFWHYSLQVGCKQECAMIILLEQQQVRLYDRTR